MRKTLAKRRHHPKLKVKLRSSQLRGMYRYPQKHPLHALGFLTLCASLASGLVWFARRH